MLTGWTPVVGRGRLASMTTYPLTIWTVHDHLEHGYRAHLWCPRCRKWVGEIDLEKVVRQGRGHLSPRELGLKCKDVRCGTLLEVTIQPPPKKLGPTTPLTSAPLLGPVR